MNRRISGLALSIIAIAVSGCSLLPESRKIDYKSAGKVPTLEVPPDLSQINRDDRYLVPDDAGRGSATFSAYAAERQPGVQAGQTFVLPEVERVRVERSGNQRWLVVAVPPDALWDTIKNFWQETGFIVNIERPEAGVMETDWAENRAKIPADIIRNTLGRVLDSLYSSGERDKFRTRLEPGSQPGTTEIYISHRAMEEVYTSSAKDETRWQPRAPDPELEAEMLRRLMVRLGAEEKRAEAALASPKAEPRARLAGSEEDGKLLVVDRFDRAWRRVGLALDRVGFTVEDRDRANGLYFVRYVDPEADNASKKSDGVLSKLAFWRSSDKPATSREQFRIHVSNTGDSTSTVQVLTSEGGVDRSPTARRILTLLQQQLQ